MIYILIANPGFILCNDGKWYRHCNVAKVKWYKTRGGAARRAGGARDVEVVGLDAGDVLHADWKIERLEDRACSLLAAVRAQDWRAVIKRYEGIAPELNAPALSRLGEMISEALRVSGQDSWPKVILGLHNHYIRRFQ